MSNHIYIYKDNFTMFIYIGMTGTAKTDEDEFLQVYNL